MMAMSERIELNDLTLSVQRLQERIAKLEELLAAALPTPKIKQASR